MGKEAASHVDKERMKREKAKDRNEHSLFMVMGDKEQSPSAGIIQRAQKCSGKGHEQKLQRLLSTQRQDEGRHREAE